MTGISFVVVGKTLYQTDLREQKTCEKRIQTFVDNTVNDLRYENKFENRVKDKRNISFLFYIRIYFSLETFCKKVAPRNLAKFTGKRLCQSLLFIKLEASQQLY